jgi:hypothetical protein
VGVVPDLSSVGTGHCKGEIQRKELPDASVNTG